LAADGNNGSFNSLTTDKLAVVLDPYHNHLDEAWFEINPSGARGESFNGDGSWDPVWEAAAHVDSAGWTAEMRIPFSQLRFNRGASQRWGMNVRRVTPARNEESYWVQIPRSVTAWASRFGDLVGLEGIPAARRIELTPYVAAGLAVPSNPVPGNPFTRESRRTLRGGADLKAGVGSNLTVQATANPDFGQVELDPAEVNLTAFESFFPERRPFFVEGSQLLQGGGQTYFYSRRIGAAPHGPAAGTFVDGPDYTAILGAAKLTGRLPGGLSVGALAALTAREQARTFDPATGVFGRVEVEPPTEYGVARLQQQFGRLGSTAGVIFTGVRRQLGAGGGLARLLDRDAVAGAADWDLRLRGGEYALRGSLGFSRIAGDSAAILRQQLSSARYFQRPDASYVRVRPGRTSLSGVAGGLDLSRISGRHWLWETSVDFTSPGFELNDAGRLVTADDVNGFAFLHYRENRPGPVLRSYVLGVATAHTWNFGGVRTASNVRAEATATFRNFWTGNAFVFVNPRTQSDALTRGGPLMQTPLLWAAVAQVANPASAPTRWNARIYYGAEEGGGPTYRVSGGVSIRPRPRWQLTLEPNYVHYGYARQYVAVQPDGPPSTFGSRYVFSHLELTEFRVRTRLNYALRPDLTLETVMEPYASSALYSRFGELAAARSGALRRYGTDGTTLAPQPDGSLRVTDGATTFTLPHLDFNVRSLRGSAVLRWEWAQGSTLFVVWQQDRLRRTPGGGRITPWSLGESLGTDGDNYLVVKATWWLGR
ncbi:MAG: hypothetical protein JO306_15885, partial [Gemmatimonadetes bacterium]|nr:hypothetical protein [Gemmatimonadota bacterium]